MDQSVADRVSRAVAVALEAPQAEGYPQLPPRPDPPFYLFSLSEPDGEWVWDVDGGATFKYHPRVQQYGDTIKLSDVVARMPFPPGDPPDQTVTQAVESPLGQFGFVSYKASFVASPAVADDFYTMVIDPAQAADIASMPDAFGGQAPQSGFNAAVRSRMVQEYNRGLISASDFQAMFGVNPDQATLEKIWYEQMINTPEARVEIAKLAALIAEDSPPEYQKVVKNAGRWRR